MIGPNTLAKSTARFQRGGLMKAHSDKSIKYFHLYYLEESDCLNVAPAGIERKTLQGHQGYIQSDSRLPGNQQFALGLVTSARVIPYQQRILGIKLFSFKGLDL